MVTDPIRAMLARCEKGDSPFPPTVLFNEDWLLRIVLDWFAASETAQEDGHPLAPAPGARWYSEPLLPSAFLPRYRGDRLAESRTHADGVIGHIRVGRRGATDLSLCPNTDRPQLAVVEAKIYGGLSKGVRNAPFFDQAARSVACLAEILRRAERPPGGDGRRGVSTSPPRGPGSTRACSTTTSASARSATRSRRGSKPTRGRSTPGASAGSSPRFARLDVRLFAWEDLIDAISHEDMAAGQVIDTFYGLCLKHNRARRGEVPDRPSLPAWACASVG